MQVLVRQVTNSLQIPEYGCARSRVSALGLRLIVVTLHLPFSQFCKLTRLRHRWYEAGVEVVDKVRLVCSMLNSVLTKRNVNSVVGRNVYTAPMLCSHDLRVLPQRK
jgi:hypothetical protein